MGPRSGNRGYDRTNQPFLAGWVASMGPRSGNRGYAGQLLEMVYRLRTELQWVHGPVTVVMLRIGHRCHPIGVLQWVHGPVTVVMQYVADYQLAEGFCFNGSTVR